MTEPDEKGIDLLSLATCDRYAGSAPISPILSAGRTS
jgi:hypothetical protein